MNPLFARLDIEKEIKILENINKKDDSGAKISIEDFAKINLIVAKVVDCEPIKKSRKLGINIEFVLTIKQN